MSQLGLGTLTGVPSLLDALVAPTTATQARRWLRRQLLNPPPPGVKLAIREACDLLISMLPCAAWQPAPAGPSVTAHCPLIVQHFGSSGRRSIYAWLSLSLWR